jgi:hypothetical protein
MSFVVRNAPGRLDWTNVPDIIADEIVRQILSTTDYFETPGHEAEALFKGLAEGKPHLVPTALRLDDLLLLNDLCGVYEALMPNLHHLELRGIDLRGHDIFCHVAHFAKK